jgi:hypothetical protein
MIDLASGVSLLRGSFKAARLLSRGRAAGHIRLVRPPGTLN